MAVQSGTWITIRAAAVRIGVPIHKMQQMIRLGAVESMRLPHSRPLVKAADLERLLQEAQRPVTNPATVKIRKRVRA